MIEGKGLGDKKINRVNISLSNKYASKLNRLAVSCDMKPTTLACLLIERCLDDPLVVSALQDEFGIFNAYKVMPVENYKSGEIEYLLNHKE